MKSPLLISVNRIISQGNYRRAYSTLSKDGTTRRVKLYGIKGDLLLMTHTKKEYQLYRAILAKVKKQAGADGFTATSVKSVVSPSDYTLSIEIIAKEQSK